MKPNILFIILDSCRGDKFYGTEKKSKTPNIDSLTKNGVYFENTISASDATLLGISSIFTGLHPFKTGIKSARFNKLDKARNSIKLLLARTDITQEQKNRLSLIDKVYNSNAK